MSQGEQLRGEAEIHGAAATQGNQMRAHNLEAMQ